MLCILLVNDVRRCEEKQSEKQLFKLEWKQVMLLRGEMPRRMAVDDDGRRLCKRGG